MKTLARAMRGPLWLVWLSLLCAGQVTAGDAVASVDSDDVPDRQPFHLSARTRSLPTVVAATFIAVPPNQDELAASPAVGIAQVPLLLCVRENAPSADGRMVESPPASSPRSPRAPPLSLLL